MVINGAVKSGIKAAFRRFGFEVNRRPSTSQANEPPNPIQPWNTVVDFNELYDTLSHRTLVGKKDCFMLYQLVRHVADVPGDVAEVGVYKGGTAKLLAHLAREQRKRLHLFDTFRGMPTTNAKLDWHKEGDFSDTTLESVQAFLGSYQNAVFHPGWFPHTAINVTETKFSFVHVDADIYESVKACCEFFYKNLPTGGVILFDDYGKLSCPGAKNAVDEFFASRPERPIYLPTGQCVVSKLGNAAS